MIGLGCKRVSLGLTAPVKMFITLPPFVLNQITLIVAAGIAALEGPQDCVETIRETYRERRDVLCDGLNAAGWEVEKPKATMFVWAKIPEAFRDQGSLEFSKTLLREAKVAVSPGIGFGEYGDDHVRFALIENVHRTRQALRGVRHMLRRVESA